MNDCKAKIDNKAEDVMTREVVALTSETDLHDAMSLLLNRRISGAPVVDEAGTLIGILSEKDCLRALAGEVALKGSPEGRVADYMSPDPITVAPATSLFDVVALFLERHIRRLPVVDDGRLVGQISRRDVLRAVDTMREHYLQPRPEHDLAREPEGSRGVHSAMTLARAISQAAAKTRPR